MRWIEFFVAPFAVKDFHRKVRKGRKEKRVNRRETASKRNLQRRNGVTQNYLDAKKSGLAAVTLNLRFQPRLPGSVVGEASMRRDRESDKIT